MGATYTNITLKGPTQKQIGDFLDREAIVAYVTPTDGDITVVYDQASSDSDEAALTALAGKLSRSLGCVAFASSVYDSDILQYHLYVSGVLADEYNSRPDYWDDETDENAPPKGGDDESLCTAFGAPDRAASVSRILRSYTPDPLADDTPSDGTEGSGYIFEEHRHVALLGALSLPAYIAHAGFQSFEGDHAPYGLSASAMRRTGPDA